MTASLTILNTYHLTAPPQDFTVAITALAARVAAEGHKGVLSYRFYVGETDGLARAVIDYSDAAAWIGHHDLAMQWPEMKALHAVASLHEVFFLGEVTDEMRAWLGTSTLTAKIHTGYRLVAGFGRDRC